VSEDRDDWTSPPGLAEERAPPEAQEAVSGMSFEQALAELEKIVQDLERGQLDLDAAINAYERGTRLKQHCEAKLREAQLRVERISLGEDGTPRSAPLDLG
jgi:exodeoxyribonuclease VII small subunit